jgi:ribosomal protein L6P/L9E
MSSIGSKTIPIPKDLSFSFSKHCSYHISKNEIFIYSIPKTSQSSDFWILELKGNFSSLQKKIPQTFGIRFFLNLDAKNLEDPFSLSPNTAQSAQLFQLDSLIEKLRLPDPSRDLHSPTKSFSKREERVLLKQQDSLWGSLRQDLATAFEAASLGLSLSLNLSGLGFKAFKEDPLQKILLLKLGFSHTIKVLLPQSIDFSLSSDSGLSSSSTSINTEGQKILLKSSDKSLLHSIADQISKLRSPEPYKGKGIIIQKPQILQKLKLQRKQGKKKSNLSSLFSWQIQNSNFNSNVFFLFFFFFVSTLQCRELAYSSWGKT